jgi:hypothetical protein
VPRNISQKAGGPFRAPHVGVRFQDKPGAKLSWPLGPKTQPTQIEVSGNVQTPGDHTVPLARNTFSAPRLFNKLALMGVKPQARTAIKISWGGRRDSNPQHPEPQSGALPLSYDHHSDRTMKVAQDRVPPSGFSPEAAGSRCATCPVSQAVEKRCNHVPITYGPSLIWNGEQLSESPRPAARWK